MRVLTDTSEIKATIKKIEGRIYMLDRIFVHLRDLIKGPTKNEISNVALQSVLQEHSDKYRKEKYATHHSLGTMNLENVPRLESDFSHS